MTIGIDKNAIRDSVVSMLRANMGLKEGDSLLILSDKPTASQWASYAPTRLEWIARRIMLCRAIRDIAVDEFPGCSVELMIYDATGQHGAEPPDAVGERMKSADVVLAPTSFSISHTNKREEACKAGARIATLPGITPEMFGPNGPMAVDYAQVSAESVAMASKLTEARSAMVESPAGTSIRFSLEGRDGKADPGIYDVPGIFGNLPAGEAYIAPVEGTAEGKIVVQKGWFGNLETDMVLHFGKGLVVSIDGGGEVGDEFRSLLGLTGGSDPGKEPFVSRRNLAELGIGTNPNAKSPDIVLEAEKIAGTVHLAIGDGSHMGGKVSSDLHTDFVVPDATLILDGTVIKLPRGVRRNSSECEK